MMKVRERVGRKTWALHPKMSPKMSCALGGCWGLSLGGSRCRRVEVGASVFMHMSEHLLLV